MGIMKMIAKKGAQFSYPEISHCGKINKTAITTTMPYEKTLCLRSNIFFAQPLTPVTLLLFFNDRYDAIVGDKPPNRYGINSSL